MSLGYVSDQAELSLPLAKLETDTFRSGLYYLSNVLRLSIPQLRAGVADIPLPTDFF
jgi:DNA-binding NtrC family response regulator